MKKKIKAFDLFSGIGGFRAGIMETSCVNYEFTGYCEIDKYCRANYEGMFNTEGEFIFEDIHDVTRIYCRNNDPWHGYTTKVENHIKRNIPIHDILFAGFPCQPHSLMGNRKGYYDTRGELFFDIAAVLRAVKPEYFILENVRQIKSVNDGNLMNDIKNILENILKYNVSYLTLDSQDYGVPQKRRRIYIIGQKSESNKINIPKKIDEMDRKYKTTWHLLEKSVSEKYYLSNKILKTILKSVHGGYSRPAEINQMIARPLTKTMHKMHRASQDNYFSDQYINGRYSRYKKIIKLNENIENKIRRITPREAFRIQGFNEELINKALSVGLSDTRYYMHTGNAVSPPVITAIINEIFKG